MVFGTQLDAEEVDARCQVLKDLEDAMQAKWGGGAGPAVSIQPFGSFPAGLSTFLSDIDISILSAAGTGAGEGGQPEREEREGRILRQKGEEEEEKEVTVVLDSDDEDEQADQMEEEATGDDDGDCGVSWTIDRNSATTISSSDNGSRNSSNSSDCSVADSSGECSAQHREAILSEVAGKPHSRRSSCKHNSGGDGDSDSDSDWESDSDSDSVMNDCGGLDIHISSEVSDSPPFSGSGDGGKGRKRKRDTSSAKGTAASPSREVQLGEPQTLAQTQSYCYHHN